MSGVEAEVAAAGIARRQHGMVTVEQLLSAGFTDRVTRRRVAGGWLVRRHQGVYQVGVFAGRVGPEMAALLACGPTAVLSRHTAAALWRLAERRDVIHVSMPGKFADRPALCVHRVTRDRAGGRGGAARAQGHRAGADPARHRVLDARPRARSHGRGGSGPAARGAGRPARRAPAGRWAARHAAAARGRRAGRRALVHALGGGAAAGRARPRGRDAGAADECARRGARGRRGVDATAARGRGRRLDLPPAARGVRARPAARRAAARRRLPRAADHVAPVDPRAGEGDRDPRRGAHAARRAQTSSISALEPAIRRWASRRSAARLSDEASSRSSLASRNEVCRRT